MGKFDNIFSDNSSATGKKSTPQKVGSGRFDNMFAAEDKYRQQQAISTEQERQQKLLDEQNKALQAFQERQQRVAEGNIFTRGYNAVKGNLGLGETLPEIQGGSQQYQDIRQAQLEDKIIGASPIQNVRTEFPGIAKGAWESIKGAVRPYGKAAEALLKGSQAQYLPKEQQAQAAQEGASVITGGAKMGGEILSGTAKYLVQKAEEISPRKNMGLMAQYSNVRKMPVIQDGQVVGEQLLDRNSPEYKAATGAWIDNVGILNYKPEYKNELERTGGDIAEIGSWFIQITRLGKVAKLEQALASMPKIADLLGVVPKVVKVGGKFMYEISKDVVDVAILDAIRGKTDEEIFSDAKAAGYGSAALRAIIGLPGAGAKLKQIFAEGKVNKTATIVEDSVGKLSAGERTAVKELMTDGKPVDDIVESIISKRADEGKDIYTHAENIESGVVKIGEQKAAIENTVVQRINPTTGEQQFYTIPKGEVDKFAKIIDTEAKRRAGWDYHITANATPEKMIERGFTDMGIAKIEDIPAVGNKVAPEVKAKQSAPAEVPVSKVEKPKTTTFKKSLTGQRVEAAAIEKKLTSGFEGTAEYTPITVKEQAKQVKSIIDKGDEHINSILSGAEKLPAETRTGSFIAGVEHYAQKTGNVEMLERLANSKLMSETSLHAQELRMLAERNPDGILAMVQSLKKVRLESRLRRLKKGETIDKANNMAVRDIKRARAIHTAPKKTWANLVEQFKCKE